MGEKVIKEPKAKKVPDLHPELKKFIEEQNKRWEKQDKRWEDQNKKWDKQIQTNQVILTSIQEILLRLERIETLPTIKKELGNKI